MLKTKKLHALAIKKLQNLIGHQTQLIHVTGMKKVLSCTISDIEDERIVSNLYLGKQSLKIKILYSDLQEVNMPIRGYKYAIFNNKQYAILEESFDAFQNELILYGAVNKEGV